MNWRSPRRIGDQLALWRLLAIKASCHLNAALAAIDAWQAAHNAEPTKTVVDAATGKLEVKP